MRKPLITPTLAIVLLMLLNVSQSFAETLSIKEVANGIFVHQGIHELPDPKNKDEIANIGFIVGDKSDTHTYGVSGDQPVQCVTATVAYGGSDDAIAFSRALIQSNYWNEYQEPVQCLLG